MHHFHAVSFLCLPLSSPTETRSLAKFNHSSNACQACWQHMQDGSFLLPFTVVPSYFLLSFGDVRKEVLWHQWDGLMALSTWKGSVWKYKLAVRNMTEVSKVMDYVEKVSRDWLFTVSSHVKSQQVVNKTSGIKIQNEQKKVYPGTSLSGYQICEIPCQRISGCKKLTWLQGRAGQPAGAEVTGQLRNPQHGIQLPLMPSELPQDYPPYCSCSSVTA